MVTVCHHNDHVTAGSMVQYDEILKLFSLIRDECIAATPRYNAYCIRLWGGGGGGGGGGPHGMKYEMNLHSLSYTRVVQLLLEVY